MKWHNNIWFVILALGLCISCINKDASDVTFINRVKWDFYKKNQNRCFLIEDEKVPYVRARLTVHHIKEKSTEVDCYFGVFDYEGVSSQYKRSVTAGCGVPLVSELCYDKDARRLTQTYQGQIRYEIDPQIEREEEQTLVDLVLTDTAVVHKDLITITQQILSKRR